MKKFISSYLYRTVLKKGIISHRIKDAFSDIIKPRGHVSPHYTGYLGWSFVSNILVSAESVLSMHSMLSVMGTASTDFMVTYNYMGKDMLGQLGSLVCMHRLGKQADVKPKKFIGTAMLTQQVSIMLECATPLLPLSSFIWIAGLATIGKNISFMGVGTINGKCIQALAKDNNIGEIYSKVTVFNTLASSIGMLGGMFIVAAIPDHTTRLFIVPFLTGIRFWTYHRSIKFII